MKARTIVAATLALVAMAVLAPGAGAATIVPNTGADDYDAAPDADCSLREAIQSGINFADFGGCVHTGDGYGAITILLSGGITYERTRTDAGDEDSNATGDFDPLLQSLTIGVLGSAPGSVAIAGNGATNGGRIIEVLNGQLHLTGVTLRGGNAGFENGGAILKPAGGGPMSLTNVTLSGNFAEDGGGAWIGDNATLVNTTISGSQALGHGGGLYKSGGQLDANNLTIAGNTADANASFGGNGGGMFVDGSGFNISNSIIAGNVDGSPGAEAPDCVATLATSLGNNLIGNSTGCSFAASNGGPQTGDVLDPPYGPGLGALQSNGGVTQTHALLPGSPAIDAGNPAPPDNIAPACATADQRGTVRPQGGRCDIGAFELAPTAVKGPPPTRDGKKKKCKKKKKKKAAAAKKCKKKKRSAERGVRAASPLA